MLRECITLLRSVSFQFNVRDSWRWQLEPSTSYTVSSTYQLLTAQDTPHVAHVAALIWHKQVPLNFYFCLEAVAEPVAYKVELGGSRYYYRC
jgi:hypothetical protein